MIETETKKNNIVSMKAETIPIITILELVCLNR